MIQASTGKRDLIGNGASLEVNLFVVNNRPASVWPPIPYMAALAKRATDKALDSTCKLLLHGFCTGRGYGEARMCPPTLSITSIEAQENHDSHACNIG